MLVVEKFSRIEATPTTGAYFFQSPTPTPVAHRPDMKATKTLSHIPHPPHAPPLTGEPALGQQLLRRAVEQQHLQVVLLGRVQACHRGSAPRGGQHQLRLRHVCRACKHARAHTHIHHTQRHFERESSCSS